MDDLRISRKPLRVEIRDALFELISDGGLRPGDRIKEADVSALLGTSRTPLREALFMLEAEGFVVSDPARGFSVVPMTGEEIEETYPILWTLESLALQQIPDLRAVDVSTMKSINAQIAAGGEPREIKDLDTKWHATLLAQSGNGRLLRLVAATKRVLRRYEIAYMQDQTLVKVSARHHAAIAAAVKKADRDRAIELLVEHWMFGRDSLLEWLRREPSAAGDRAS